jgi:hypothetical protein
VAAEDPKADVHAIAYEHALRSLDQQADQLEQLRTRVGTLVSAAVVVASLLTGFVLTKSRLSHASAVGVFALLVAAAMLVEIAITAVTLWWPASGVYRMNPAVIISQWADTAPTATCSDAQRDLALYMGQHWDQNAWSLDRRLRWFSVALIAFLVELLSLGIALWDVTR